MSQKFATKQKEIELCERFFSFRFYARVSRVTRTMKQQRHTMEDENEILSVSASSLQSFSTKASKSSAGIHSANNRDNYDLVGTSISREFSTISSGGLRNSRSMLSYDNEDLNSSGFHQGSIDGSSRRRMHNNEDSMPESVMSNSVMSRSVLSSSRRESHSNIHQGSQTSILQSSEQRQAEVRINQALTSNKLRYESVGLYGRDKEMSMLKQCWENLNQYAEASRIDPETSTTTPTPTTEIPEQEQQQRRQAWTAVQQGSDHKLKPHHRQQQWVFIGGHAGTGKTTLCHAFERKFVRSRCGNGCMVAGKYDIQLQEEPYLAIREACQEICGELLSHHIRQLEEQRRNGPSSSSHQDVSPSSGTDNIPGNHSNSVPQILLNQLGEELPVLSAFLPELMEVVGEYGHVDEQEQFIGQDSSKGAAKERFHSVLCLFLRTAASLLSGPLVLMLDDMQWADAASLEFLEAIFTDRSNTNIMLLGLYRSNEVDPSHPLNKAIRDFRDKQREYPSVCMQELEIGNLAVDQVNSVILDLLNIVDTQDEKTLELAELCHRRTLGNAFFVIMFMSMLKDEKLLEFDVTRFRWKWSVVDIERKTAATSNVVEMIAAQMLKFPSQVIHLLAIASCLGTSFERSTLKVVWDREESSLIFGEDVLDEGLQKAVQEGLLEQRKAATTINASSGSVDDTPVFQWVHDKVQEAASGLIEESKVDSLKSSIGWILDSKLSPTKKDKALFVIVNLLNESTQDDPNKRIRLARLNRHATRKSMSLSAFSSGFKFATAGIGLLPEDDNVAWGKQHYSLSLDLYASAAECALRLGENDAVFLYSEKLLEKHQGRFLDKLRSYKTLVECFGATRQYAKSIEILIKVLKELNYTFPSNKTALNLKMRAGLPKTKSALKSLTPELIAQLPICDDLETVESMKLLHKLSVYSFLHGDIDLSTLVLQKLMKMTLQHGLCEFSPEIFVRLAKLLVYKFQEWEQGERLATDGLSLMERLNVKHLRAACAFNGVVYVLAWRQPTASLYKSLLAGYQAGMASGDHEHAMWVRFFVSGFCFCFYVSDAPETSTIFSIFDYL